MYMTFLTYGMIMLFLKVTNLTTWKGQLALKNKELQLENER